MQQGNKSIIGKCLIEVLRDDPNNRTNINMKFFRSPTFPDNGGAITVNWQLDRIPKYLGFKISAGVRPGDYLHDTTVVKVA